MHVTRSDMYFELSTEDRQRIDVMVQLFLRLMPHVDSANFDDLPDAVLLGQHYAELFMKPNSQVLWAIYNARRMLAYHLFNAL